MSQRRSNDFAFHVCACCREPQRPQRSVAVPPPDSPAKGLFRSVEHNSFGGATATATRDSSLEFAPFTSRKDTQNNPIDAPKDSTPRVPVGATSPHRDASGVFRLARPSCSDSGPRSSEIILGLSTSEIPKEHLVKHERLTGFGPAIWRACWKDVPAMIQELQVTVPCIRGVAQRGQIINMWRGTGTNTNTGAGVMHADHASHTSEATVAASGAQRGSIVGAVSKGGFFTSHVHGSVHVSKPQSPLGRSLSHNMSLHSLELTNEGSVGGGDTYEGSMTGTSISSHHGV